jgi:hypothetical protein
VIETEDPYVETPEATGSLAARATARRQEISERKSLVLEVPGYEGLLAVEYRALAYHEGRKIAARHQRQHDDAVREIYIAADQLIRASVNSYELREDGTSIELGIGWGRELAERLGIKIHDTTTARQAVLACFPSDVLLTRHFVEYGEWLQDTQSDVDDEQRADFLPTASPTSRTTS